MKPFCPECHQTLDPVATACPHCQNARPPFGWPRDPLLGELLDQGRLEIKARLGAGGFAVVYRATHLPSGQQRAVKVLGEQFGADAQMQTLFLKEAEALGKLSHPHLVRYDAYGVLEPSRPWISMELVEGHSLRQEVAAGAMPPTRALALALQIAQALEAAHAQNLLHRDLNPGNIMLVRGAPEPGCVKVIDFGLAKVLGRNTVDRRTNRIVGTPAYMAPEQFSPGTPLDARLDLWQLGAVMHFMLTGHPPYTSEDHRALLRLHHRWQQERKEHLPGPRPSHLRPALVRLTRVDDLISRLLSADVALRPASARALLEELRLALDELQPQSDHTAPFVLPDHGEADSPTAEQPASLAQQRARYCPRCQGSAPAPEAPRCAVCSLERPPQGWPVDELSGSELAQGRYRVLYRAGRGKLGAVYEASDLQQRRAVAVRLVEVPSASDALRELVTGRMQQLKALHHPNLASVLDTGVLDSGVPYVVMEKALGTALHLHIWPPRYGFPRLLDPAQVMLYGVQLASAFSRLHQLGWVHGGATPSNLLLMEHREAGAQIQLTGLGNAQLRQLARRAHAPIQLTDPRFAAPEQLMRGDVGDPRADLYQLGAMLHFMLTGWPPFPRDERNPKAAATAEEVLALQRAWEGELGPRPSRWIPALTAWPTLDRVVAGLLHPRPEKRPRQPLQVALLLSEALRKCKRGQVAAWENTQEFEALQATQEEEP